MSQPQLSCGNLLFLLLVRPATSSLVQMNRGQPSPDDRQAQLFDTRTASSWHNAATMPAPVVSHSTAFRSRPMGSHNRNQRNAPASVQCHSWYFWTFQQKKSLAVSECRALDGWKSFKELQIELQRLLNLCFNPFLDNVHKYFIAYI